MLDRQKRAKKFVKDRIKGHEKALEYCLTNYLDEQVTNILKLLDKVSVLKRQRFVTRRSLKICND